MTFMIVVVVSEQVAPVIIKDNVWLGDGSKVLKGVTIGENSIVAAGAVVSKEDIPANVIVSNPATVVKAIDSERQMITRKHYFADPVGQQQFFDDVDKTVLEEKYFV